MRRLDLAGVGLLAAGASTHLLLAHHLAPAAVGLMLAMVAVCLPCAVSLVRGGSALTWATVVVMASLMLLVHEAWPMHEMAGHGRVLSLLATLVAGTEVGVGLTAIKATLRPTLPTNMDTRGRRRAAHDRI